MTRGRIVILVLMLAGLASAGGVLCCHSAGQTTYAPIAPRSQGLRSGTDVTFLVAADTHLGFKGLEEANERQIEAMNTMRGRAWPRGIGGVIGEPKALVVAGDMTEWGAGDQWDAFVKLYGRTGSDGKLKYPVFLGTGNHDRIHPLKTVLRGVKARHGALVYGWDWGDLHLVMLDEYPTEETRRWLAKDLAMVGRTAPVILFMHFTLSGPFSDYWLEADKEAFGETIAGYNVIGIFHGHYHASRHYRWKGYDVYDVGSPRHRQNTFCVVRVTDGRLAVGNWRWDYGQWQWDHVKAINGVGARR